MGVSSRQRLSEALGGADRITTTMVHEYTCSCMRRPTSGKGGLPTRQILIESTVHPIAETKSYSGEFPNPGCQFEPKELNSLSEKGEKQ
jgi:hypothetical protein